MVGYWDVEHQWIFDSFVSGKPMELGPPDTVDGPGCLDCGKHWMTGKTEPCEESDDT